MTGDVVVDVFERIERSLEEIRPYITSHKGTLEVIDFDPLDGKLFVDRKSVV